MTAIQVVIVLDVRCVPIRYDLSHRHRDWWAHFNVAINSAIIHRLIDSLLGQIILWLSLRSELLTSPICLNLFRMAYVVAELNGVKRHVLIRNCLVGVRLSRFDGPLLLLIEELLILIILISILYLGCAQVL